MEAGALLPTFLPTLWSPAEPSAISTTPTFSAVCSVLNGWQGHTAWASGSCLLRGEHPSIVCKVQFPGSSGGVGWGPAT